MSTNFRVYLGGLLTAVVLFGATETTAQETRSLKIENGQVYIDGRLIPDNELPRSLNADDVQMQYVFTGEERPVIRVGEEYFVLEEGHLREAGPRERSEATVILRNNALSGIRQPSLDVQIRGDQSDDFSAYASPYAVVLQRKAKELQQQAVRLQELQSHARVRLEGERLEELERAAQTLTAQAEEAARMAEAMPRMQVQGYLTQVQQKNEGLFNRLVDEREMEHETIALANEIRSMEEGQERARKTDELRAKLDKIFDLKQDNRRQEMEQLEKRLEDLQDRLKERESKREEIVETRLRQLLHMSDDLNW